MIVPIILSGGSGTRLWPLSREEFPKQLLPLNSELSMLQETAARLNGMSDVSAAMVVCNESHRFMVAEQMRTLGFAESDIVLEPCGRNTAPAVAIAALQAMVSGGDPVLLVLPADHLIQQVDVFQQVVAHGSLVAQQGKLVTFGIVANKPETGYGYIKAGDKIIDAPHKISFKVECFVEKPDIETAQSYLSDGNYFWNSGMFMFKASKYLAELKKFYPEIFTACQRAHESIQRDLDFLRLDADLFAACPSDSIDYAVMEKTTDAVVLPLDAGWNDIGSWSALWEVGDQCASCNVTRGDVLTTQTTNCYLHSESRLIAAVGIDNLVVVETADAVLVANKDRVQDVKEIVQQLKQQQRSEALLHRCVNRPWGTYTCVDSSERFQVKRITVNPGSSLSLQLHHHRAEHWIVVSGTARVTCGEKQSLVSENESIYIPIGVAHRLENPGILPLELIEVQSGSYLGEDDIVRFDDTYGRS